MPKHVLLYIYNSYNDPIVQGSVLSYVKRYKTHLNGKSSFSLITFEQKEYLLSNAQIKEQKKELANYNLTWHPLTYHSGGKLILFKKLFDIITSIFMILKININSRINLIYTVGSIAGSMGYFLSKLFNTQLLVHTFEPHSEFMVDFNIWKKSSISFRLLNYMEKIIAKEATYLMTGTDAMIKRINKIRLTPEGVYKAPSCVNLDKFTHDAGAKNQLREQYNLQNKLVLLYLGKFGGIYFTKEPFVYFSHFLSHFKNQSPHILIISQNKKSWIRSELDNVDIQKNYTILNNIPFNKIENYINMGDIGYCGIPPLTSQKYRSPIKNGEYLACGIPYIVYEGVSEDDITARNKNVGVVLKNNSEKNINKSLVELDKLMLEDGGVLSTRCINTAKEYRDISQTDEYFKNIFVSN